jgi:acetylcholinesterase
VFTPLIESIFFLRDFTTLIAFGFLASQEVKDAGVGNLGLQDRERPLVCTLKVLISRFQERMALRWVQKYIHSFGGDPTKVTM